MALHGGATVQADLARGTIAEIKGLTVDRLKRLLRAEHLPVSGIKHELQLRLIDHVQQLQHTNQEARLKQLRDNLRGNGYTHFGNGAYPSPFPSHTPASSASPQYGNQSPSPRYPASSALSAMPSSIGYSQSRVSFKISPFYAIQKTLAPMRELEAREQTRDTVRLTINLDNQVANDMANDPSLRIMVFCAAETYDAAWKPVDVAFPQHAELKVNQEDVKANLKGLKNKPGSTRPADITPLLRKKSNFPNSIELVYALTSKKHFLLVNLVRTRSIESLVSDLRRGKYLSKDRILREMQSRAADDDIVVNSSKMSLKDPVQMTRIDTPCRGMSCRHNECFDAAVYLSLQEQAPTWTCPICSKSVPWEQLVFDQFVEDILLNTSSDTEQVTVEPDGQWHLKGEPESRPEPEAKQETQSVYSKLTIVNGNDSDDDDLVEITPASHTVNSSFQSASLESRGTPTDIHTPSRNASTLGNPFMRPPPQPSASATPSVPPSESRGTKRPRSEVIDLTLSDDEDEEPPVSRIKRPSFSSQPSDSIGRTSGHGSIPGITNRIIREPEYSVTPDSRERDWSPRFNSFTLPPLASLTNKANGSPWNDSGGGGSSRNEDMNGYGGYTTADGSMFDTSYPY